MKALRVVLIPLFVAFGTMPFFGDTVAATGPAEYDDWVPLSEIFDFAMATPAVCVDASTNLSGAASGRCSDAIEDAWQECTDDEEGGCWAAIGRMIWACRWALCAGWCTVTHFPPSLDTVDCIVRECLGYLESVP